MGYPKIAPKKHLVHVGQRNEQKANTPCLVQGDNVFRDQIELVCRFHSEVEFCLEAIQ